MASRAPCVVLLLGVALGTARGQRVEEEHGVRIERGERPGGPAVEVVNGVRIERGAAGPTVVEAVPVAGKTPQPAADWYLGAEGYRRATMESKARRAPVIVYVSGVACADCRKFESEVLPSPDVQGLLAKFIRVRLEPERSPADRMIARVLGVSGYPSIYVSAGGPGKTRKIRYYQSARVFVRAVAAAGRR
jgi:hypothetical protein